MTESDLSKRCTATWIVDDVGDDTFEVAVAFAEVEGTETGEDLSMVGVGLENGTCSLTLITDDTTHFCGGEEWKRGESEIEDGCEIEGEP
jgi:hypothetical protein